MTDPLNIILITADQHRGDCFGFEGRAVQTPHLDAMAAAGTRFSNCTTPNPICQPARASILTGLLPRTHGVYDNGIDLPPATGGAGFSGLLAQAGYRTGFYGKAHFATSRTFSPTGTPECRASTPQYGADWHGPYMGFDEVGLMILGHMDREFHAPPEGQHYEHFFHRDGNGAARLAAYHTQGAPDVEAFDT